MKCRVCENTGIQEYSDIGYLCKKCNSISSFSKVSVEAYSSGNYAEYQASRLEKLYVRLNAIIRISGMIDKHYKTWLDVGCGKGHLLSYLSNKYLVSGVEPEDARAQVARSVIGHENVFDSFDNVKLSHDVISAFHVLEHLETPNELFEFISNNLTSHGIAIIEVPNKRSFQAFLANIYWPHWDKGIHRTHFSKDALIMLAEQNNLRIVKTQYFSLTEGVIGMLSAILRTKDLAVYTLLKRSWYLKFLLIPFLVFSLLLEFISSLFFFGGVIRIKLKREN